MKKDVHRESLWSSIKLESIFVLRVEKLLMAENPEVTANTAETEAPALTAGNAPETAVPKSGSNVIPPVETPPPGGALTESPELTSTMSVELTTSRAETEALLKAIQEVSTSVEASEGQEGTASLIKVMLLGLKAQRSTSQGFSVEMKQIAVKQLDLLRHVATGFQDQTDHLQQISDDIGTNLNALAQGFVK